MEKFFGIVIKARKVIMLLFLIAAGLCGYCQQFISVNYDMNSYLPENAVSTVALEVMEEEFEGAIPNARVLIKDVTEKEAPVYKEKLEEIDGVISVMWLDDKKILDMPLEMYDQKMVETYYKDNAALFTVTIEEESINSAVPAIRR